MNFTLYCKHALQLSLQRYIYLFNRKKKHPPGMQPWQPTHRRTRVSEISDYFAAENII